MNKKFYAKDLTKPFEKNISKAEVQCLLKDQIPSDGYPGADDSSIMPLPYNIRDKDKLLGKRNYNEFSQKESLFDNGYAEYLYQSQNLQNSLLNNYQVHMADSSIDPIMTRNRGRNTRGPIYAYSPNKQLQKSEKSFSFCNSLREASHQQARGSRRTVTFNDFSDGRGAQRRQGEART